MKKKVIEDETEFWRMFFDWLSEQIRLRTMFLPMENQIVQDLENDADWRRRLGTKGIFGLGHALGTTEALSAIDSIKEEYIRLVMHRVENE